MQDVNEPTKSTQWFGQESLATTIMLSTLSPYLQRIYIYKRHHTVIPCSTCLAAVLPEWYPRKKPPKADI